MTDTQGAESEPDDQESSEARPTDLKRDAASGSLLDEHRAFVLGIDDSSRKGYSFLALSAMLVVALVLWVTGIAVWSLHTLWLAPLVFFLAVLIGRIVVLSRHEARLRARVLAYCRELGFGPEELWGEAEKQGRYEFFTKLFSVTRGRPRARGDAGAGRRAGDES